MTGTYRVTAKWEFQCGNCSVISAEKFILSTHPKMNEFRFVELVTGMGLLN